MKLKYASKDQIPEAVRDHYVEKNGAWHLKMEDDDGRDPLQRVDEFRTNNVELRRQLEEATRAKAELEGRYSGIDLDQYKKAKAVMDQMADEEERKLISSGRIDEVIARRTAAAITKKDDELRAALKAREDAVKDATLMRQKLGVQTIERQIQQELDTLGMRARPGALDDILARTNRSWRIDEKGEASPVDPNGKTLFGSAGTALTMKEFAQNLASNAPHLFEDGTGGGAGGSAKSESVQDRGGKKVIKASDARAVGENLDKIAKGEVVLDTSS